jgi:hypothetical protein
MFGALLGSVLPGVLSEVLGKVLNQLPVSENEKENIKVQAEKELANHAGKIAEAEAQISTNAKDAWLEELHNGGFLATTWRPLLAVTSTFIMFWDAVLVNVVNTALSALDWTTIAHANDAVLQVALWTLLTLIGARGVEKISVVRKKGK